MARKGPPVPRKNWSRKGTGSAPEPKNDKRDGTPKNLSQQGRQSNIKQNTRNQCYQQDR